MSEFSYNVLGNRSRGHIIVLYLKGKRNIPTKFIPNIEKHYGISASWLMTGKMEMLNNTRTVNDMILEAQTQSIKAIDKAMQELEHQYRILRELKQQILIIKIQNMKNLLKNSKITEAGV